MKKILTEFKQFAIRGNVVDLAMGIIIGGAFGKIVSSLVGDVALPVLGILIGNIVLKNIHLGPIAVGNFIQATIDFLIISVAVFGLVKIINILKGQANPPLPPNVSLQEKLLTEIRDLLRNQSK